MAFTTTRIAVHFRHQFRDGVNAITDHEGRITARSGDQLVAHHQKAIVMAGYIALDDDLGAGFHSGAIGRFQMRLGCDIDGHAAAMVAVLGFDHYRQAKRAGGGPGFFDTLDLAAIRYRHTGRFQELLGELFVLGDGLCDGAGAIDFGGLDATLTATPAELYEAAAGQAPIGNAAFDRRRDDRAGGGTEPLFFVELA